MTSPAQSASPSPVFSNQHFTVEACTNCSVPGYLIVTPTESVLSLSHMSAAALDSLGPTLALATQAIETVVAPERVYCALFAEQSRNIHFHLFPRTTALTEKYAAAHPDEHEISGPRLMDWARRVFQQPIVQNGRAEALEKIRVFLRQHVPNTTMQT